MQQGEGRRGAAAEDADNASADRMGDAGQPRGDERWKRPRTLASITRAATWTGAIGGAVNDAGAGSAGSSRFGAMSPIASSTPISTYQRNNASAAAASRGGAAPESGTLMPAILPQAVPVNAGSELAALPFSPRSFIVGRSKQER